MGCIVSVKVNHEVSLGFMQKWRSEGKGQDFLLLGIKETHEDKKVYFSGAATADRQLVKSLDAVLKKMCSDARRGRDDADHLWDLVWHNTRMTSGWVPLDSKQKDWFPIGKHMVELLDTLGSHGWVPFASPNYGGSDGFLSVDWPMIILKKDLDRLYEKETVFFAVKDHDVPEKLCACGPPEVVEQLRAHLANTVQQASKDVREGFDDWDTASDWDIVWHNASITSGNENFSEKEKNCSLATPYFPKGKVVLSMLTEVYKLGWELVCSPNFGGSDLDWPCFIFKRLKSQALREAPLVFAAVKDQNVPGKLCLSVTPSHLQDVTTAMGESLQRVKGNEGLKSEKDDYDADHDEVLRNT
eukprot:Skav229568  [mRNA]  locus=scaffold568:666245:667315:+ [translate_table: standard]